MLLGIAEAVCFAQICPKPVEQDRFADLRQQPHRSVEEDIATIAKMLADNYFDTDVTSTFVNLAIQLTLEQPLKIPFVAAIVLHANMHKPDLALEVLARAGEVTQQFVDEGAWRDVKLMLRFYACLQGLFEGDGVFTMLEELFSRAVELQTASSEDVGVSV